MDRISRIQVQALPLLTPGDQVEAFSGAGVVWQGTVETVARDLGIFWIRTLAGDRKLIDVQASTVYRLVYAGGPYGLPFRKI
ncbi:hypothetical protein QF038_004148 [Pseudarthrobacter sp. W1I19]|uniref:hypothetical protein n=1 Tax=Pseudarthrobacter sp. W1I19 TaxID=3042288 RepID=UPI0027814D43|nr:hypothetical protein [Pseudarthrobacter sp. W1I19]MDQ0925640.1 hypothetical protein [Pseudarthrobacter sp. W1I19]